MTDFQHLLESMSGDAPRFHARVPKDWGQGRTTFGGLVAALALRAMRKTLETPRPLLTLDTAFMSPVPPGDIEIVTTVLREGRSVTYVEATLITAEGRQASRLLGVFGQRRPSDIVVAPTDPQPAQRMEDSVTVPYIEGIMPAAIQHFELSFSDGSLPYSGHGDVTLGGYCRHRTANDGDVESLIALLDLFPAPAVTMVNHPFNTSTVRWSCHVLEALPLDPATRFWFVYDTVAAKGGYTTIVGRLYAGQTMVAWSEQLMALFDKRG